MLIEQFFKEIHENIAVFFELDEKTLKIFVIEKDDKILSEKEILNLIPLIEEEKKKLFSKEVLQRVKISDIKQR